MANPSKAKGTAAETRVVKYLRSFGIQAERKALSGSKDCGDIQVVAFGYGHDLVFEVKSGIQTENPSRGQIAEWMRQAVEEGKNSGCHAALVVARHRRSVKDYDVWFPANPFEDTKCLMHWYLDDWCEANKS